MNPAKQPSAVSLDTMPSYSDHEDSSEDMIFSLKLPDSPCKYLYQDFLKLPSKSKFTKAKNGQRGIIVLSCILL